MTGSGQYYVYTYTDPRNNLPFYIGKGSGNRARQTWYGSRNRYFNAKFQKIINAGMTPILEIIFRSDDEDEVLELEELLISELKRTQDGGILCNLSAGGKGNTFYEFDKEFFDSLGVRSDQEIADDYGCCRELVCYYRNSYGIPPKEREYYSPPPEMGGWNKTEVPQECLDLLGKMPDKKLAEKFGISSFVVKNRRCDLQIPAFGKSEFKRVYRKSNPAFEVVFTFKNDDTGETFRGNRQDLAEHLNSRYDVFSKLVRGLSKSCQGWRIVDEQP